VTGLGAKAAIVGASSSLESREFSFSLNSFLAAITGSTGVEFFGVGESLNSLVAKLGIALELP